VVTYKRKPGEVEEMVELLLRAGPLSTPSLAERLEVELTYAGEVMRRLLGQGRVHIAGRARPNGRGTRPFLWRLPEERDHLRSARLLLERNGYTVEFAGRAAA
jgi:predicted ArsR family transcriptional regulator